MHSQDFLKLSSEKKVKLVNDLLKKESSNHLQNVAKKLEVSPSTFSKIMRNNDNYQYIQSKKQYYKLMNIEEYKQMAVHIKRDDHDEVIEFLQENIDDLKSLLQKAEKELILEPEIYATNSKTITKSIQVNADIYDRFSNLVSSKYPHLRLREVFSKCLLDFVNNYQD
ncbi:hypothetical protein [Saliterribacillus persicus]|uniref:Uncharacterized protein n=1 Tax=Saliterribacillus persicus TaxID=930114 RepID=A0A368X6R5_9BACI|nr:hypothetical protein [Saliterribacillus persicus]RCW62876.1 hypothetical protein DFR57_12245 [Saliterribacillus persicus]